MDSILKNTGCEYVICFAARLCEDPSQYARLPLTPGENSLFQYGDCNHDHAQFLLYCHESENMGSVSVGGKEGSISQSRAPSQTTGVGLISLSPPGERFHFLNFLESVVDKASQPCYGHRFGFGTSIDQNDGSAKSSTNDVKQGSRLLIDAYRGNDTSHEKLPKGQWLNAYQGMTNLQCNEEDIQGKELKLGPPRPNVGSNRHNAALPEKEFKTSRPSQTFRPRPDICANAIEDATPNLRWDLLSSGKKFQELANIAIGQGNGNKIPLLHFNDINSDANISKGMMLIQECYFDATCSYVIYAPLPMEIMNCLLNDGRLDPVLLLSSGFAIVPSGSSLMVGSLITAAFQIIVVSESEAKLSPRYIDKVNNLVMGITEKTKNLLLDDNPSS